MRAGPVRQLLRPARLGIGEVRGAEHANENLRLADFARRRIGDPDPLALERSAFRFPHIRRS